MTQVIGVLQSFSLKDNGPEMLSGNFRWSGQIALFLMFVILRVILLLITKAKPGKKSLGWAPIWLILEAGLSIISIA